MTTYQQLVDAPAGTRVRTETAAVKDADGHWSEVSSESNFVNPHDPDKYIAYVQVNTPDGQKFSYSVAISKGCVDDGEFDFLTISINHAREEVLKGVATRKRVAG